MSGDSQKQDGNTHYNVLNTADIKSYLETFCYKFKREEELAYLMKTLAPTLARRRENLRLATQEEIDSRQELWQIASAPLFGQAYMFDPTLDASLEHKVKMAAIWARVTLATKQAWDKEKDDLAVLPLFYADETGAENGKEKVTAKPFPQKPPIRTLKY